MSIGIERLQRARKEYKCDGLTLGEDGYDHPCQEVIRIGQQYRMFAIPPWQDYDGDVDDDGRPIAFLKEVSERSWQMFRVHLNCVGPY